MWIHKTCNNPVRQDSNQSSDGFGNNFTERYWWCDHCMAVVNFVGKASSDLKEYHTHEKELRSQRWAELLEICLKQSKEMINERDGECDS